MSVYNDKNLSLKNIALTQFEMAREMPAAIELFANNPKNLDIQTRMLAIKINAILHNVKAEKFVLALGINDLSFMNPMFAFLHGDKKQNLDIISFDPTPYLKKSKIYDQASKGIESTTIAVSVPDIINTALKADGFLIVLLGSTETNSIRECIDAFSHKKSGFLLIHNYAIEKSPSHHLYAVERGLRILELPDGSGECLKL